MVAIPDSVTSQLPLLFKLARSCRKMTCDYLHVSVFCYFRFITLDEEPVWLEIYRDSMNNIKLPFQGPFKNKYAGRSPERILCLYSVRLVFLISSSSQHLPRPVLPRVASGQHAPTSVPKTKNSTSGTIVSDIQIDIINSSHGISVKSFCRPQHLYLFPFFQTEYNF